MSSNAHRFHPTERPAPKASPGRKPTAKGSGKKKRQKQSAHVNKYAKVTS
jgi:hypothetical protein